MDDADGEAGGAGEAAGQISRRHCPRPIPAGRAHRRQILGAALRARRPRALARLGAFVRRRSENGPRPRPRRAAAPARRHRSDRSPQGREGQTGCRQGQAVPLSRGRRAFFNQHEAKWRNRKHRTQFTNTLRQYAFPVLGDMAVAEIDTPAVLRAIEPIWMAKTETASRVRGRIESVLDWCTVRGYRTGDNPARWTGHLSEVLPARGEIKKTVHHPAMPHAEVPGFMAELRKREGVAARALEFVILTAARTGEVIGARWSEVDLGGKSGPCQPDA